MAGLIFDDVARFTVHQTFAGRNVANIVDLLITPDTGVTRPTAVATAAGYILDAWDLNLLPLQADNLQCTSVSWVDLDSASGTVGSTTTGPTQTWPAGGGNTGSAAPGNVAARINKSITAARGQRQGRMYVCGVVEGQTDDASPNSLNAAAIAAYGTAIDDFLDDIQWAGGGAQGSQSIAVVLHTRFDDTLDPPAIVADGISQILDLTVDPTLGSQRRRLRG